MNASTNPIRIARKAQRYTLQQIADKVGVSKTTMFQWETGQMLPHPSNALRLTKVLPALTLNKIYAAAAAKAA